MTRVACIDIGTVTARLAVADVEDGRVTRLVKQSTICNLGENLTRTGVICDAAIKRVSDCVSSYVDYARAANAPGVVCTLTSAARDAENSRELLGVLAVLGLHPQVIPGEVEGTLTFLGVAQDFPARKILVADNGGGSTELAVGSLVVSGGGNASAKPELDCVRSIDVGCRRITERFLSASNPPRPEDVSRARTWALGLLSQASCDLGIASLSPELMITTGGTVTSLMAIDKRLVPYDTREVHLHSLTRGKVDGLVESLSRMSVEERAQLPGLQPKRANVILGGALVISALMEAMGFDLLTVSESDLLFGLSITAAGELEGRPSTVDWHPDIARLG